MTEMVTEPATPRTAAEYKAAIDRLIAEMLRIEGEMERDRAEIERFRAASEVITKHTDSVLQRLEQSIGVLGQAA